MFLSTASASDEWCQRWKRGLTRNSSKGPWWMSMLAWAYRPWMVRTRKVAPMIGSENPSR